MNLNGGIFLSLFNKVLASIGVGAATVDTKLHKSSYTINETVTGVVEVTGAIRNSRLTQFI